MQGNQRIFKAAALLTPRQRLVSVRLNNLHNWQHVPRKSLPEAWISPLPLRSCLGKAYERQSSWNSEVRLD